MKKHNNKDDCWIIVDGKIYGKAYDLFISHKFLLQFFYFKKDVTTYIDSHPGGDAILRNAGADSTEGFRGEQHPGTVETVISDYYIGDLAK